jgi:transcription initiation factor TFIIH subunit 3
VGAVDSVYLQQAAHLTNGYYHWAAKDQRSLLQLLLTAFLPSKQTREALSLPAQSSVDFRARAFDSGDFVEIAHVCTVCLSLFASSYQVCPICGAEFSSKTKPQPANAPQESGSAKRSKRS